MKIGTAKIFDDICTVKEEKRKYVGASYIGLECKRAIWYNYWRDVDIAPRIRRIFDLGKVVESYIINKLKQRFTVYDIDKDGNQFGFVDGIIAGHFDGVIVGLPESTKPHLLEIKTAKDSSYNTFVKEGVKSNQQYYVQVLVYMMYAKVDRCLWIAYNKDTSDMYFERIEADNNTAKKFIDRAKLIFEFEDPPDREFKNKMFYKCKMCPHYDVC